MYMAKARNLRLGPSAPYIPLTCVGGLRKLCFTFGVTQILAFLDINMLV